MNKIIRDNKQSIILLLSMVLGGVLGLVLKERASILKPIADTFLNLLFVAIIPMIAISIVSSIASMGSSKTLGKILGVMFVVFLLTGIFAAIYMLFVTKIFDPSAGVVLDFKEEIEVGEARLDVLSMLTVDDFYKLLSKENLLALIVFSLITGLALSSIRDRAQELIELLAQASELVNKIISIIMVFAPIGIGAYFATLTGEHGASIVGPLGRTIGIFFLAGFVYFFLVNAILVIIARGPRGLGEFFRKVWPPFFTAFGTSSSAAALAPNMEAATSLGIREDIKSVVVPLGANLHKDGTVMIQIIKISLLAGILGLDFWNVENILIAIIVSYIAATVCGAVPGGGYTAEILLVSAFGLPEASIPIMVLIATVVDSIATAINTTTDLSAAMVVEKFVRK